DCVVARGMAGNTPITVGGAPLIIGSYNGLSEHFTGDLVELIVWPRALSEAEIRRVSEDMQLAVSPTMPRKSPDEQAAATGEPLALPVPLPERAPTGGSRLISGWEQ